ncbi:hypothetical protein Y032_0003g1566 [Ancylostoma ceylanicum]|uniref:Uncharacterized protein n=1 Tax=Ancylostoma ceylanicum TaxID=53326 RepID=A0A016VXU8_9BILA|nr:hypothetical protein Y032_0003g1566 [Ancylostoma ceylanicum]
MAARTHSPRRSTRPRLRHMVKSAFISCISRFFHAVLSLAMTLSSPKTPKFGKISNTRISAGAAFKPTSATVTITEMCNCNNNCNYSSSESDPVG